MVTKPLPLWQRWLRTAKNKERVLFWYYVLVACLNFFIVFGLIAFFVFLLRR